ncbi:hypothetical protein E2562_000135 [Oryza meyeriana var. granulata]|uniref:SKP1 component POZ domain-containing protein n=1 Tax=Oryza meyeriana var. granulata TaxID=110450 RepID=A0A6G1DBM2_9ORYZ|nr:hypothetical protein E2562_000135 [Oryza meyeriana var. granulata]
MAPANEGADAGNMIFHICNMIVDDCTENGIALPNVTSNVLAKNVEYCTKLAIGSTANDASSSSATTAARRS